MSAEKLGLMYGAVGVGSLAGSLLVARLTAYAWIALIMILAGITFGASLVLCHS